jgi:hypothetical protein
VRAPGSQAQVLTSALLNMTPCPWDRMFERDIFKVKLFRILLDLED